MNNDIDALLLLVFLPVCIMFSLVVLIDYRMELDIKRRKKLDKENGITRRYH